ncbi:MAG: UDP-3-O-(3-hydroxymyristoyl)glucosamine N-acyltransferase [Muribaculaceae bacterium]
MEFSAQQIASLIGGTIEGNPQAVVSSFAKIEEASEGSITFLANPKYNHYLYSTRASIVLVARTLELEQPVSATLIRVDDPYATLAQLLQFAQQAMAPQLQGVEQPSFVAEDVELPADAYVGAFAYIGTGCRIGRGVKVYPQAYVGPGVTLGDNTVVYPGARIYHGCRIGARCIIHAGAVIGADGFGFAPTADGSYSKIPQIGIVEIHDDVEIGANTTIDRATMGATVIEQGAKLDNLIQAGHNVTVGRNTVMAAQVGIAGSTHIGANCMVGGQVGFAGHITVGDGSKFGAQSGVPNSVAANARVLGSPAVPERDFARQVVYTKRLADLFARVAAIEKVINNPQ